MPVDGSFPPELEREIFEITAELYPETIRSPCLLLVAHRVYEWIERIKYRTVTNVEPTQACPLRLLLNALRSNGKPSNFFHDRVRHLYIAHDIPANELQVILSACSGIRSLALPSSAPLPLSILECVTIIQPRRLAVYLFYLFDSTGALCASHSLFTFITHLQLFDPLRWFEHLPWSWLALLPALTHLAFRRMSQSSAVDLLSSCPNIEGLVRANYDDDFGPEDWISVDDVRFVSMPINYAEYATTGWLAGTRGGEDFWVRAERFVAKKRRGEIKPSLSFTIPLIPTLTHPVRFEVLD
ncbi:hypothetical protein FB451DRAFT_1390179 [Mycena latifolia]|nr:hypothetical protein FB451DRAFT_1390179 [Mycena latifolia]